MESHMDFFMSGLLSKKDVWVYGGSRFMMFGIKRMKRNVFLIFGVVCLFTQPVYAYLGQDYVGYSGGGSLFGFFLSPIVWILVVGFYFWFKDWFKDFFSGMAEFSIPQEAEQWDAELLFDSGEIYRQGQGIPYDYKRAFQYYMKSAEKGYSKAQYRLGLMYAEGQGVRRDYKEAVKWFRKSAEQGLPESQNSLGLKYAEGKGVRRDYKEAVKWWRKSAEQGHSRAQLNLGKMYRDGLGVIQDNVMTHMYCNIASMNRNGDAKTHRDIVEKKMTPSQLEKAKDLAREWHEKKGGMPPSDLTPQNIKGQEIIKDAVTQYNLGVKYDEGHEVIQDYKEAVKWYRKSAEQGHSSAQYNLGNKYNKGQGVPQDYKEAVKWYKKSAEQGDSDAQYNLGVRFYNGEGVIHDYVMAHMYWNLAASKGHKNAIKGRGIVEKKMTASQIEKAEDLAREWMRTHQ